MERPKRVRKPNVLYDPSVYVLTSFPKKNKHTIIPKHQVTIDAVDEQNGTIRSSGFIQSIRIIGEGKLFSIFSDNNICRLIFITVTGTRAKCQERATQYSRNTESEEVDLQPADHNEDAILDDDHVYSSKKFYNNDDIDYLPTTTGTQKMFFIGNNCSVFRFSFIFRF
jgi:hypothetical protein